MSSTAIIQFKKISVIIHPLWY